MIGKLVRAIVTLFAVLGLGALAAAAWLVSGGIDARPAPPPLETAVMRRLRPLAIPAAARARVNPVPAGPGALADGMAHFADHCASCHGNDGGGDTELGRGLYPRAPDMRASATQQLTDGELFYIIEHGIRFTGMPAWGGGSSDPDAEAATWRLVHFIRHLPELTDAEVDAMRAMNPRSPDEWREEEAIRRFLAGEDPAPDAATPAGDHGGHE